MTEINMNSGINQPKRLYIHNQDHGHLSTHEDTLNAKKNLNIDNAIKLVNASNRKISSALDFGCGKGGLVKQLKTNLDSEIRFDEYDLSLTEHSLGLSKDYDLITCVDVLEHIDRCNIDETLIRIKRHCGGIFFYCINLIPTMKQLSDGRNAHVLLAPPDWWIGQISSHFTMNLSFQVGHMPDGSRYPLRLFGCATNNHNYFDQCALFILGTQLTKKRWILENSTDGGPTIALKALR
jgi:hypothetical protein